MKPVLNAVILSTLPVFELRGGIPAGVIGGLDIITAYLICVPANLLIIPLFFFFLEFIHHKLLWLPLYQRLFDRFLERTRKRVHVKIEKYGYFGLFLFTAIPLPVTGAYTATLGAWFFKMKKFKSFIAIGCGVLTAGIIVSLVVVFGSHTLKLFFTKT